MPTTTAHQPPRDEPPGGTPAAGPPGSAAGEDHHEVAAQLAHADLLVAQLAVDVDRLTGDRRRLLHCVQLLLRALDGDRRVHRVRVARARVSTGEVHDGA